MALHPDNVHPPRLYTAEMRQALAFPSSVEFCNSGRTAGFFPRMTFSPLPSKRHLTLSLGFLAMLLLFAGCARRTSAERVVDSAVSRYARVANGMTKEEVVRTLGTPASQQGNIYRWETVGGPENHASIDVHFDRAGKVVSTARTRARRD